MKGAARRRRSSAVQVSTRWSVVWPAAERAQASGRPLERREELPFPQRRRANSCGFPVNPCSNFACNSLYHCLWQDSPARALALDQGLSGRDGLNQRLTITYGADPVVIGYEERFDRQQRRPMVSAHRMRRPWEDLLSIRKSGYRKR